MFVCVDLEVIKVFIKGRRWVNFDGFLRGECYVVFRGKGVGLCGNMDYFWKYSRVKNV